MAMWVCNFYLLFSFGGVSMYQVLYRKWRPKVFDDVVGQPQVTVTLKNELKLGRINHAYLFTGSRGTGKTTCAKIFAKAVNCLDLQNGDPCGKCENCIGIDEGNILDVVEMDAASNRGIADIKTIIDEAQFRPTKGKFRVYIIDEVHMLSNEAFNALLKTLEEPPEYVIFILATTEVHKIPATILSRCQRFDFHRITPEKISSRLSYVANKENAEITDEAATLISVISDGAMRDSLSLMDRCLSVTTQIDTDTVRMVAGLAEKTYLSSLANCCINKNTSLALETIGKLHNEGKDMARLCDELLDYFRNLMLIKSTKNPQNLIVMSEDEFEQAQTQADYISLAEIVYMMDVLQIAYQRMGKGNSNRTELEMALIKLSAPELESNYDALAARVTALERALKSGKFSTSQQQEPVVQNEVKPIEAKKTETVIQEQPQKETTTPKPVEETPVQTRASVNMDDLYKNAKPFRQWPEVVENIKKYSRVIAGAFTNTNAYENGNFLLIEAESEIPFKLLKEGTQRENIRTAIQEITGKRYSLGPYKKPEETIEKQIDPLKELVDNLKQTDINITEE